MRLYDLRNQRFGHLFVLELAGVDQWGQARWLCECGCGNKTIVTGGNLRSGKTTSCGCRKYERFAEDLTGKHFGRLTVLDFDHMGAHGRSYWLCRCDCGEETVVRRDLLLSGHTTSCGCRVRDVNNKIHTRHSLSEHPLYIVWEGMKQRCENSNSTAYHNYGEKGIYVCDEWHNFENFYNWAMDNGYETGLSIDRKDTNGPYAPWNCRWADDFTQANNRNTCRYITYNGITHTIAEWSRLFGVHYETLRHRINRGDMRDFEEYFDD